jgi:hypothetical protein
LAERYEIAERYAEWEIIGPPEVRQPIGAQFNPWMELEHELARRRTSR